MKNQTRVLLTLLIFAVLAGPLAMAQTSEVFDLSWSTIDAGGGTSSGGEFEVSGTIGQPDVGMASGGAFELTGGFWNSEIVIPPSTFSSYIRLY
jgi:hypothetical protein